MKRAIKDGKYLEKKLNRYEGVCNKIYTWEHFGALVLAYTVLRHNGGDNCLAEPKQLILTNWRFAIGGSLRLNLRRFNWRKYS